MDQFDQPEILDDLFDGWMSAVHAGEGAGSVGEGGTAWAVLVLPSCPGRHQLWLLILHQVLIGRVLPSTPLSSPPAGERKELLYLMQEWSTTKNMRISILSGDAHVGGVGRFYRCGGRLGRLELRGGQAGAAGREAGS